MTVATKTRLGEMLVERRLVTADQVAHAVVEQRERGKRIGETLVALGYISETRMLQALSEQLGVPLVTLTENAVHPEVLAKVPSEFALRHTVLPLHGEDHTLTVAMADPLDIHTLDDLQLLTGLDVEPVLSSPAEIRRLIERFYMSRMIEDIADADGEVAADESLDINDLQKMAREELVIQLVNLTINQALQDRASDIHIEPFERDLAVRYRIDGILHEVSSPPKRLHPAIVSRIKILSDMNIAERRLPQDGRMRLRSGGRQVDIRVSTVPTLYGESVVMRLLDRSTALLGLEELGMRAEALRRFRQLIAAPYGIILVTGPTGSGKTTSLYAALQEIATRDKKCITIEEPVEYQLPGVNQIQVNANIGLTFASGLRHIVRQDPDIIMVGEIRDRETADIAIHAALTGHLVLSTLHTNDAPGAISRLLDMGAEPFLVASSMLGAIAQRLVRMNCPHCRRPTEFAPEQLAQIGIDVNRLEGATLMRGIGCEACKFTGFAGRRAVFEILPVDDQVRRLTMRQAAANEIRDYGVSQGMTTLVGDGRAKVLQGLTTPSEVLRVCQRETFED
jgi:type II secretion system protein E